MSSCPAVYGFADVVLNGETVKVVLFVMTLPADAIYMQAFPRECSESFLDEHKRAFEFFGGVPVRISYDNTKVAEPAHRSASLSLRRPFGKLRCSSQVLLFKCFRAERNSPVKNLQTFVKARDAVSEGTRGGVPRRSTNPHSKLSPGCGFLADRVLHSN